MAFVRKHSDELWQQAFELHCNGASSASISIATGLPAATIRAESIRKKWPKKVEELTAKKTKREVERIVNQQVSLNRSAIVQESKRQIEQCLQQSREFGIEALQQARQRLPDCDDRNVSSIATLARTGVDIWRTSLGLGVDTGAREAQVDITLVLRGSAPSECPPERAAQVVEV